MAISEANHHSPRSGPRNDPPMQIHPSSPKADGLLLRHRNSSKSWSLSSKLGSGAHKPSSERLLEYIFF